VVGSSQTSSTGASVMGRLVRRPSLRRLLAVVIGTYIGVTMLVGLLQSKLIYFPSRTLDLTPTNVGLKFDDVTLMTRDDVKISAWFVPRQDARATVLFFHGNAGNNGDRVPEIKVLHSLGYAVMLVDYRGYGKSEGAPSESGTYLDAIAAWEHLTQARGLPANRIVIMGESIGGAVAIDLARRHSPGALVVQSSFTRLSDIAALHYPFVPVRWLLRHRYDSIDKVGAITCPKLFFHSTDDSLIPIGNGRALYDAAADPKQFVETPGDHNGGGFMYADEHAVKLQEFIDSAMAADPEK
jgi:fermentation-respiration switch protein FrsA (DUF1100 family)